MPIADTYKYNSVVMARFIIAKANEARLNINITKLQKLLYIAYGAYLALYGERLLNEHPQAWPYGPVFPNTRRKLLKVDFNNINLSDSELREINNDQLMHEHIDFVFSGFGSWTATQLVEWSHSANTPWDYTTRLSGFKWADEIDDNLIAMYFKSLIVINGEGEN